MNILDVFRSRATTIGVVGALQTTAFQNVIKLHGEGCLKPLMIEKLEKNSRTVRSRVVMANLEIKFALQKASFELLMEQDQIKIIAFHKAALKPKLYS
jgi:hypothetical protein